LSKLALNAMGEMLCVEILRESPNVEGRCRFLFRGPDGIEGRDVLAFEGEVPRFDKPWPPVNGEPARALLSTLIEGVAASLCQR
jgi:hypothetical protein